jgi:threonyl-tRNA synthetase
MKIEFPDGSKKEVDKGLTALEIIKKCIGEGLARAAIAAKFNDVLIDLSKKISKDGKLVVVTWKDKEGKEIMRHSTAHVMAAAVKRLFPKTKFGIGPAVEEGFYYDFDVELKEEDLAKIEQEMKKIVKEKQEFVRDEVSKAQALKLFAGETFKLDLIKELEDEKITVYRNENFVDLCRGPHVINTSKIGAFKLTKLAGAYWKGDAKNKQLTRVYGIVFPTKHELDAHLFMLEEAKKRDHRKIGKEMELFSIHDQAPGMPFYHNKGNFIFTKLIEYMTDEIRALGYELNRTPIILNKGLWKQSGHWDHYKENMYFTKIDEQDFAVKPMNCPGNLLVFKNRLHSYKELPIKAGEFGLVHRHELSGVLSGLFRVRVFTQDDAHVFCTEDQLHEQIIELLELVDRVYSTFGFEYNVELSTMPEKAMGDPKLWKKAEKILAEALEAKKIKYQLNPGEGAFYGPKIDYHLKDAIGRTWQCGTIQLDFSMPEKFDLTFEGQDGKKHRPVMLHRAIYGSIERFLGILIEHYAGKFPMWISPVQVRILPISDRHIKYADSVKQEMQKLGLRVEIDDKADTTSKKIRNAELSHVNYILVVGDKEVKNKTVNVRTRDNKILGEKKVGILAKEMLKEVEEKR